MDVEYKVIQASHFIEAHLNENITAEDIAHEIAISNRQLYRFFQKGLCDSPLNYLRTRRLTEASKYLCHSNHSIIDIAFHYGFHSAENFCRAFSQLFWHSPSNFRKISSPFHFAQRKALTGHEFPIVHKCFVQNPRIVRLEPKILLGHHFTLPQYGFHSRSPSAGKNDSEWNAIYRLNHNGPLHELENFNGTEVRKADHYPDDLDILCTPASTYVVFPHEGPEYLLDFTVSKALSYLVKSHFYLGDAPTLLRIRNHHNFCADLYIPVSNVFTPYLKWWNGYGRGMTWRIGGNRKSSLERTPA